MLYADAMHFETIAISNDQKLIDRLKQDTNSLFSNPDIFFHGTRLDYDVITSILEKGLLSQAAGSIVAQYLNGYNKSNQISLSESPANTLDSSGLINYSLKSGRVGFAIRENIKEQLTVEDVFAGKSQIVIAPKTEVKSGIPDEVFANWRIPSDKIVGILIDPEILEKPIRFHYNFEDGSFEHSSIVKKINHVLDRYDIQGIERERVLKLVQRYGKKPSKLILNAISILLSRTVKIDDLGTWKEYFKNLQYKFGVNLYDKKGIKISL